MSTPSPSVTQALHSKKRLDLLESTSLLDSPPEEAFDRFTRLASNLLHAPVALISLVDEERQFFKSHHGLTGSLAVERQSPISHSYCKHLLITSKPLVVADARRHPLLQNNPAIKDYQAIAYLGVPLRTSEGETLGSLCTIDAKPRDWTEQEVETLQDLAVWVMTEIQLRLLAQHFSKNYLEVRDLELQRTELTQMLVHDLRNPLHSLIMGLELIHTRIGLDKQAQQYVSLARLSGESLLRMVTDILDVNKADVSKLHLDLSLNLPQDIIEIAHAQTDMMAYTAGVKIIKEIEPGLRPIRIDAEKMRRVLVNLISNAIQHTPATGTVRISARQADDNHTLVLEVADSGYGISKEHFGQIFEKYGTPSARSGKRASTGLGLPFCKIAIEAHGGEISVESELGAGTLFRVEIPYTSAHPEASGRLSQAGNYFNPQARAPAGSVKFPFANPADWQTIRLNRSSLGDNLVECRAAVWTWRKVRLATSRPTRRTALLPAGRFHPEDQHRFRLDFQRDRDRIVHSRSFRRLEYKTQVFLNGTGDHYRTRMTHTIEVSCIARTLARALGLNEDLAEAIALAHDLGHPPFGHLGEETLHKLMAKHGGFRHNAQSVRVVEELELKYPEFNGLNLTWEVREGLHKPYPANRLIEGFIAPSLEAQAVDLSDQIAYICHDLDDGLESGLINEQELNNLELWRDTRDKALAPYPHLEAERGRYFVLRTLLGRLVEDVIDHSSETIKSHHLQTSDDVRRLPAMITFSPAMKDRAKELLTFLYSRFYHHPSLVAIRRRSIDCLEQLFDLLVGHPHLLSQQFSMRVKNDGEYRATCDYLACLTDRQTYLQHQKLIGGLPSLEAVRLEQAALL